VSKGSSSVLSLQISLTIVKMVYIFTAACVTYFIGVYLSTPPLLASPPAYSGPWWLSDTRQGSAIWESRWRLLRDPQEGCNCTRRHEVDKSIWHSTLLMMTAW